MPHHRLDVLLPYSVDEKEFASGRKLWEKSDRERTSMHSILRESIDIRMHSNLHCIRSQIKLWQYENFNLTTSISINDRNFARLSLPRNSLVVLLCCCLIDLNPTLRFSENWLFVVSIPRRHSGILERLMALATDRRPLCDLSSAILRFTSWNTCFNGYVEWGIRKEPRKSDVTTSSVGGYHVWSSRKRRWKWILPSNHC